MYKVVWLREYDKRAKEPKDCEKWLNDMEKEGWKLVGITNLNYYYYGCWVFHKE